MKAQVDANCADAAVGMMGEALAAHQELFRLGDANRVSIGFRELNRGLIFDAGGATIAGQIGEFSEFRVSAAMHPDRRITEEGRAEV
jgi:hypothetical protein